jgi:hypothetical protein
MTRVEVQKYKKSLFEIRIPDKLANVIWDFYVTKSVSTTASQARKASDYGWKTLPLNDMLKSALITEDDYKILMCNSINATLKAVDLATTDQQGSPIAIDVDRPRFVCVQPYTISDEEKPKGKIGKAECMLTHIRNAFAHGNTYFFDNKMVLLEDKDNRGAITARFMLKMQTLLDWIVIIDKEQKYYDHELLKGR